MKHSVEEIEKMLLTRAQLHLHPDHEAVPLIRLVAEAFVEYAMENVATEREECAKIAADWGARQPVTTKDRHIPGADHGERYASAGIAAAIRARTP